MGQVGEEGLLDLELHVVLLHAAVGVDDDGEDEGEDEEVVEEDVEELPSL